MSGRHEFLPQAPRSCGESEAEVTKKIGASRRSPQIACLPWLLVKCAMSCMALDSIVTMDEVLAPSPSHARLAVAGDRAAAAGDVMGR